MARGCAGVRKGRERAAAAAASMREGWGLGLGPFIAAFMRFEAGEAEGAGAVGCDEVAIAVLWDAIGIDILVLAVGEGGTGFEHCFVCGGEEVVTVSGADDTGVEFGHTAGAVGEEADSFSVEGFGVGIEEGGEGFVDAGGVGVAGLAVIVECGGEGGLEGFGCWGGNIFETAEAVVGFVGDFCEGEVEAIACVVWEAAAAGYFIIFPCGAQGREVHTGRVFTLDEGFCPVGWAPEIHDILGVEAGLWLNGEDVGVGGDEHGDGAGALGGFTWGAEVVACDIGGEDEDAFIGVCGDHGEGEAEGHGTAVAGFLEFDAAAAWGEFEQAVAEEGGGLGLVDAGFGCEEEVGDIFSSSFFEDGQGGVCGEGDDILVWGGYSHSFLADTDEELVWVDATDFREGSQVEVVGGGMEGEEVDADGGGSHGAGLSGWGRAASSVRLVVG